VEAEKRAGWPYGFAATWRATVRQMVVADAHKDGVRLIVHAECLATAMLELRLEAQRAAAESARR